MLNTIWSCIRNSHWKPSQSIRALLFHNPSTTYSPVIFPHVWQSSKIPNDYYNLRISSVSWRVHDRIVAGGHQRSTNSISFPRSSLTVRDDRSHENSFRKEKRKKKYTRARSYGGEFRADARQTASRAVDSSRLSWNKYDAEGSRLPSLFW